MRALVAIGLVCAAGVAGAAELTVGPYVQDVREDGFTIAYETDVDAAGTVVADGHKVATRGTRHEARVDGLKPGTRVKYRLLVDGRERAASEVATAASDGPLTFVVYGDTRDGAEIAGDLSRAILAEQPDLALHTGDIVRSGDDLVAWRSFFAEEAPLISTVPVYYAIGNHELYRDPGGDNARRFLVPPDDGRTRRYYSFRRGAVKFIALDGNGNYDAQADWLKDQLESATHDGTRHVFVFVHQSPFSMGGHCGNAVPEARWVSLFEQYQVRAVFAGHDHCYQRLERNGVRYFVSGGGGAQVYPERESCARYDKAARRVYQAVHHYLRVRVVGDEVDLAAITLDKGQAPLDRVHFDRTKVVPSGEAPPLVDDRLVESPLAANLVDNVSHRWPLAAGGLLLFLLVRGLRRRGRSLT